MLCPVNADFVDGCSLFSFWTEACRSQFLSPSPSPTPYLLGCTPSACPPASLGIPRPWAPLCKLCRLWVELAVLHGDGQTLLQAALPEQAACSCFRARNLTGGIEQVVSRHFCVVGAMHFFSSSAVRSSWITLCKLKLRNSQHEAAPGTGRLQPN